MAHLLEVRDLRVSFRTYAGEFQSVRGASFFVDEGETVALVGESGCGKSVTARSVMGLIAPPGEIKSGSRILFAGQDILTQSLREWERYRGEDCAIVFQDALAALNPTLSVGAQIAEKIAAHHSASRSVARKEALRLLELVGIPAAARRLGAFPHELSGGQRQRVMIAIALACGPRLLLADEPTTALDVTVQAEIIDLLRSLQKSRGASTVMITHDLGLVAGMAQRIAVMYAGRIVETGARRQVFYAPAHPYTRALLDAVPRLDAARSRRLAAIDGEPPDTLTPLPGCAFAPRCKYCMSVCLRRPPPLFEIETDHMAECWRLHDLAPREEMR